MKNKKRVIIYITSTILILSIALMLVELPTSKKKDYQLNIDIESNDNITNPINYSDVITKVREEYNNNDIKGILEIENTDYIVPVLQGSDNDYYLNHDAYGNSNYMGSIYLDYRVDIDSSKKLLIYGNNEITDEDKVTDKVPYGVVIATYKDTDGNELTTEVRTTDLVGKEYNTEEKDFFGYSLKEINGNENGTYIDDTIYVEYIYTNTMGTGDIEELPPQTGVEQSNLYNYLIIISMLVLSVRGYKKVKETL